MAWVRVLYNCGCKAHIYFDHCKEIRKSCTEQILLEAGIAGNTKNVI